MRGSPLLRSILVVMALLLLLVPMRHLTRARGGTLVAVQEKPAPKRTGTKVHLELTSTRVPFQFELLHLGKVIWRGEPAGNQVSTDVSMEFPKEGIDLELKGGWKDGESVAAVQLKVTSEGGESAAKSVWGKKDFDEVLTIP